MAKKSSLTPVEAQNNVGKKSTSRFVLKEVNGKVVKSPVRISKVKMGIIVPEKLYLRLKAQSTVRNETMAAIVARALENELSAMEKATT